MRYNSHPPPNHKHSSLFSDRVRVLRYVASHLYILLLPPPSADVDHGDDDDGHDADDHDDNCFSGVALVVVPSTSNGAVDLSSGALALYWRLGFAMGHSSCLRPKGPSAPSNLNDFVWGFTFVVVLSSVPCAPPYPKPKKSFLY